MIPIKDVIKGHVYNLLDVNKELKDARNEQCLNCPLLLNNSCNKSLAIRTKNQEFVENKIVYTQTLLNQVSLLNNSITGEFNNEEYTSGCGCNLNSKQTLTNHTCPVNLWKDIDHNYLYCIIEASEINEHNELGVVRFANKYNREIKWRK
jgi:hypothetical protein